jgi:2'-5' RNA ligase
MPFVPAARSPWGPPTHSAVIVRVPGAEPVVADHRRAYDESASWGVPAHVTVLFPFADPAGLDDGVHARLTRAVTGVRGFMATFASTAWFGDTVLWLAPEPAEPFRSLLSSVATAFPEHPPYAGAHDEVVPHLTVGQDAPVETLRAVERQVRRGLPLRSRVSEVEVIAGRPEVGGAWAVVGRFPLA